MQFTTIVLQVLSLALLAQAQILGTSNVTCPPDFGWALNGLNQTPCVVAGYLASECYGAPWNVPPYPPNSGTGPGSSSGPYSPPGFGGSQPSLCRCNTVEYNLIQACSLCQAGLVGTWSQWVQQCTASLVNVGKYPKSVPDGTEIPTYAYYDSSGGQFDPNAAQKFAADHTGKKQSHTGAIVGGVVGGVVGLILIGLALALYFSERFQRMVGLGPRTDANADLNQTDGEAPAFDPKDYPEAPSSGWIKTKLETSPGNTRASQATAVTGTTAVSSPPLHAHQEIGADDDDVGYV